MKRAAGVLCIVLWAVVVIGISLGSTGCGRKVEVRQGSKSVAKPPTPEIAADLIWTSVTKVGDDHQALFVVRVTNSSDTSVPGATMTAEALDKAGTILGSGDLSLPLIPPKSKVDYFGSLGGTAFSSLTGQPTTVKIKDVSIADGPRTLETSEVKLSKADPSQSFTEAPYAYDLSVKITNNGEDTLKTLVHQQVVLYDAKGKPVGGDDGSSDNQPKTLDPGASYREQWTGIPAERQAKSAVYSVWPE